MADITQPIQQTQQSGPFIKSFGLIGWCRANGAKSVKTGQRLITKEDSPKKGTKFSVAVFTLSDGSERSIPLSEKMGTPSAKDLLANAASYQIGVFDNGHELLCASNELEGMTEASISF